MERPARHRHLQLRDPAPALPVRPVPRRRTHGELGVTTIDDIRERLTEIRPLGSARDIIALGMVRGIDLHDGTVTVHLEPGSMTWPTQLKRPAPRTRPGHVRRTRSAPCPACATL